MLKIIESGNSLSAMEAKELEDSYDEMKHYLQEVLKEVNKK
jgi:hypothetical protein